MLAEKLNNWLLKYKEAILAQELYIHNSLSSLEEDLKHEESIMKLEEEWREFLKQVRENEDISDEDFMELLNAR